MPILRLRYTEEFLLLSRQKVSDDVLATNDYQTLFLWLSLLLPHSYDGSFLDVDIQLVA